MLVLPLLILAIILMPACASSRANSDGLYARIFSDQPGCESLSDAARALLELPLGSEREVCVNGLHVSSWEEATFVDASSLPHLDVSTGFAVGFHLDSIQVQLPNWPKSTSRNSESMLLVELHGTGTLRKTNSFSPPSYPHLSLVVTSLNSTRRLTRREVRRLSDLARVHSLALN
jgi:hypothetical protein